MAQNLDALRLALQHSPDNAPLLMLFADACLDDGLLDEAEQSFQRVLKDDPAHADARLGLARVALLQGKTSQAAVRAEQIVADHYVAAMPKERLELLLTPALCAAEPRLTGTVRPTRRHFRTASR